MSEFIRCPTCRGKKTILSMGMFEKKCTPCLGVGMVEVNVEESKLPSSEEYNKLTEEQSQTDYENFKEKLGAAKRGRKPR